jgi:hypothetical protein
LCVSALFQSLTAAFRSAPVELSEAESESAGESIPFEGPAGKKEKEVTKNGDVSAASDQDEDDDEEEGDEPDVYGS